MGLMPPQDYYPIMYGEIVYEYFIDIEELFMYCYCSVIINGFVIDSDWGIIKF